MGHSVVVGVLGHGSHVLTEVSVPQSQVVGSVVVHDSQVGQVRGDVVPSLKDKVEDNVVGDVF